MLVAASLRDKFLDQTLDVAGKIRKRLGVGSLKNFGVRKISPDYKTGSDKITVAFIDGGVGEAEIFLKVPLIVRGGIFRIKEGERDLEKREIFEFFPVLIGDLEGGEKGRGDYASVVRIIIELSAILRVLDDPRYLDVNLIMLHGPILYHLSPYSKHWFFENDILTMTQGSEDLIDGFRENVKECQLEECICSSWKNEQKLVANCFIAFLLNQIIDKCLRKGIDFVGVVERPDATEIGVIIFEHFLKEDPNLAKNYLGRAVRNYKNDAREIIRIGNYNDPLLFSIILSPGEYLDFYEAEERYSGFVGKFQGLEHKLPKISYTYLKPVENAMAIRVEFPQRLTDSRKEIGLYKTYEYSRLLPNYAFPIGLDVADKFAKVPKWMVEAYRKYILFNFGRLTLDKELEEHELRKILMFFYLHRRDFQSRPKI
jgi:hypothetical protein